MKNFKLISGLIISIVMIIVTIKVINYLPLLIQTDSMRRYNTIEEVKKRLGVKALFIPTFFPEELRWPPSEILAQGKPFLAIIMEFKNSKDGSTDLVICQSTSKRFSYEGNIKIKKIRDSINYTFNGRNISILTGSCENSETCTKASWDDGKYRVIVSARFEPPLLLRIIESMIH